MIFSVENGDIVIDTMNASSNLIPWCDWGIAVDEYGSSVNSGDVLIDGGIVKANFNIVASNKKNKKWGCGALVCRLPPGNKNNLLRVKYIKLMYKSSSALKLVLPQHGLTENCESYEISLPYSKGVFTTKLIAIDDMAQPHWVKNNSPLDLSKVNTFSFTMQGDDCNGVIEIKELIVYNYQGELETTICVETNRTCQKAASFITFMGHML